MERVVGVVLAEGVDRVYAVPITKRILYEALPLLDINALLAVPIAAPKRGEVLHLIVTARYTSLLFWGGFGFGFGFDFDFLIV